MMSTQSGYGSVSTTKVTRTRSTEVKTFGSTKTTTTMTTTTAASTSTTATKQFDLNGIF